MTARSLDAARIDLSLVAHTNVGKTTLMRTLLRADIGEVADRPHVTERAEGHVLVETDEGDTLRLWDTPGFGDSARLYKRLVASDNPLGWLQSQLWDRFADRPFFSSQAAVRNVKEESDVVLYLANAAEDPAAAKYVERELRILAWVGKPVLVLLNQTGRSRGREADAADESAWRDALAAHVGAYRVIALDAFARCWAQEDVLLAGVEELLAAPKKPAFMRLRKAWRQRNLAVFDQAMKALAGELAEVALDREPLGEREGALAAAARWVASLARQGTRPDPAVERAVDALAHRLDASVRANTDRLIALHGLTGRSTERVLARLAGDVRITRPADVGKTGVIGGVVSGALGGLAADLGAGGLTFGAGALLGAILGALGGGGAARAYNTMVGIDSGEARWSRDFLAHRPAAAIARYLAVAHYGRGRGDWVESEYPPHWQALVDEVVAKRGAAFDRIWVTAAQGGSRDELAAAITPLIADATREALVRLYPSSEAIWRDARK